jgi:hypothetical protein
LYVSRYIYNFLIFKNNGIILVLASRWLLLWGITFLTLIILPSARDWDARKITLLEVIVSLVRARTDLELRSEDFRCKAAPMASRRSCDMARFESIGEEQCAFPFVGGLMDAPFSLERIP